MELRELAQEIQDHGASRTVIGDGPLLVWARRRQLSPWEAAAAIHLLIGQPPASADGLFYLDCEHTLTEACLV